MFREVFQRIERGRFASGRRIEPRIATSTLEHVVDQRESASGVAGAQHGPRLEHRVELDAVFGAQRVVGQRSRARKRARCVRESLRTHVERREQARIAGDCGL
jgi:hypothetical protein